MALTIDNLQTGDIVAHWHDQGAGFGSALIYSRVIKIGKCKIRIRCETGDERWKYPHYFDRKVDVEKVAELGINWR